jgi:hypothetical protein
MSTTITYNGSDLFNGIAPTPFVSTNQDFIDFGDKWNQVTNITLNGFIPACNSYNHAYELQSKINSLVSRLSQNYKTLVIGGNTYEYAIVESINIENSPFNGILPFTINFQIHESKLYKESWGVVEPTETVVFSDEKGDRSNFTHSISAKGIKTSSSALDNAKSWVNSRFAEPPEFLTISAVNSRVKVPPIFVKNSNGSNYILESVSENIDSINGSYGRECKYVKFLNTENPLNAFLSYSVDVKQGDKNDPVTVTVQGSLERNSLTQLRSYYSSLSTYSIASKFASNLKSTPVSASTSEFEQDKKLTFSAVYNDDLSPDPIIDETVEVSKDNIKNISTVTVNTKFSSKYGDVGTRWDKVQKAYASYNGFLSAVSAVSTLDPTPTATSITNNENQGEISWSATWTNKKSLYSDRVINISSSVSYTPSVNIHVPNSSAFVPREHNIQNLQCANRSKIEISVSATAKPSKNITDAKSVVNSEISRIKSNFGARDLLESKSEKTDDLSKSYSRTELWSFEGQVIT